METENKEITIGAVNNFAPVANKFINKYEEHCPDCGCGLEIINGIIICKDRCGKAWNKHGDRMDGD